MVRKYLSWYLHYICYRQWIRKIFICKELFVVWNIIPCRIWKFNFNTEIFFFITAAEDRNCTSMLVWFFQWVPTFLNFLCIVKIVLYKISWMMLVLQFSICLVFCLNDRKLGKFLIFFDIFAHVGGCAKIWSEFWINLSKLLKFMTN